MAGNDSKGGDSEGGTGGGKGAGGRGGEGKGGGSESKGSDSKGNESKGSTGRRGATTGEQENKGGIAGGGEGSESKGKQSQSETSSTTPGDRRANALSAMANPEDTQSTGDPNANAPSQAEKDAVGEMSRAAKTGVTSVGDYALGQGTTAGMLGGLLGNVDPNAGTLSPGWGNVGDRYGGYGTPQAQKQSEQAALSKARQEMSTIWGKTKAGLFGLTPSIELSQAAATANPSEHKSGMQAKAASKGFSTAVSPALAGFGVPDVATDFFGNVISRTKSAFSSPEAVAGHQTAEAAEKAANKSPAGIAAKTAHGLGTLANVPSVSQLASLAEKQNELQSINKAMQSYGYTNDAVSESRRSKAMDAFSDRGGNRGMTASIGGMNQPGFSLSNFDPTAYASHYRGMQANNPNQGMLFAT